MGQTVAALATIDLNDVAVFVRVVDGGSFTRAAEQLGLPKSAVSRRVARLEEALGARLLQRSTRRLHLTEAGTRYHQHATQALATLGDAATEIGELQDEPRGSVRLTAPPDLAFDYLTEPLAKFAKQYPKVAVELVLTVRRVDLVAEGVDFALRAGTLRDSSLIARRIVVTPLVPMAAQSYVARRGLPRQPEELARHDCILFRPENGRNRWTLIGPHGERTVSVTGPLAADDMRFVRELTLTGIGIGLIPMSTLAKPSQKKRLVRVLPEWCGPGGSLYLVYPAARHVPQRVMLLREHLFEHLRAVMPDASRKS